MGPLTGYRVWFEEKYQQRANSWMLMVVKFWICCINSTSSNFITNNWLAINFLIIASLILISIILISILIPSWETKRDEDQNNNLQNLSHIWKNKFFISLVPLAFFNYGGVQAIQTLWAGPWMLNVTGYDAIQSATGLFWINVTMLFSFLIWGYFLPKLSSKGIDSMRIVKFTLPISYIIFIFNSHNGRQSWCNHVHSLYFIINSNFFNPTSNSIKFPTKLAGNLNFIQCIFISCYFFVLVV